MSAQSAKTVHTVIGAGGPLCAIASHCARLERLNGLVRACLPAPLEQHCRVANLERGILTLHSDGPGWTTRLRFELPRLLRVLRQESDFASLEDIRLRQAPVIPTPPQPPRQAARLSAATGDHLRAVAAATEIPALREALLRLASRAAPSRER
jgi:hypothetical protein